MKREDISAALSGIKTEYIEESEDYSIRKGQHWKGKTVLVAACLACVVGLSMLGGPGKNESAAPEAGGADSAPTAGTETASGESSSVTVKLLGMEEGGLRAVITGSPEAELFPVGTEVLLDLSETAQPGGEPSDQTPATENLWMIPAEGGEDMEITFDSWEQEGEEITLHVGQLLILN